MPSVVQCRAISHQIVSCNTVVFPCSCCGGTEDKEWGESKQTKANLDEDQKGARRGTRAGRLFELVFLLSFLISFFVFWEHLQLPHVIDRKMDMLSSQRKGKLGFKQKCIHTFLVVCFALWSMGTVSCCEVICFSRQSWSHCLPLASRCFHENAQWKRNWICFDFFRSTLLLLHLAVQPSLFVLCCGMHVSQGETKVHWISFSYFFKFCRMFFVSVYQLQL